MGAESEKAIGNTFKRVVASGALLSSLATGVGITQIDSVSEASASTPTSNQLLQGQFNYFSSMMKRGKYNPEGVNSSDMKITHSYSSIDGGQNTVTESLISRDRSTLTQISLMVNTIPNKNGMHLSSFSVFVYPNNDRNKIFYGYRLYNTYAFHGNYDGWEVQNFGNVITPVNKEAVNTNYYWGIAISGMNPNAELKPIQISHLNGVFNEVKKVINDARRGEVVSAIPVEVSKGTFIKYYRFTDPSKSK